VHEQEKAPSGLNVYLFERHNTRDFLFHPFGSLPAEGPGSEGVRRGFGGGSEGVRGGGRGSSGPSRARIARFGRMSQRFSREAGRFRGPAAEKLNRQGMGLCSRLISLPNQADFPVKS